MSDLNILIVDDHALFGSGATELIQRNLNASVQQLENPLEVLDRDLTEIDLIITDIDMPQMNGLELIERINCKYSEKYILVISMHNKPSIVTKCIDLGVNGYILKFDSNDTFIEAIEKIMNDEVYFSKNVQEMLDHTKIIDIFLTPREEEVIKMISLGHQISEIAKVLFISTETVKTHVKNIRSKLNVKSKSEIIQYARDNLLM